MTVRIIIIGVLSLVLGGCVALDNPFAEKTIFSRDACGFNFNQTIELERVRFTPSDYWAGLSSCQLVRISRDTHRDGWRVTVMGVFGYLDVVGTIGVAHFGIGTDVHRIGQPVKGPEEWLAWKKAGWKKRQETERYVKRDITRVRRRNLDCWRIASESYERRPGSSANDKQIHFGVGYTCWENGNDRYHPIGFSAGVAYRDGKPLYDINIEQELLKPVLDSLVLKELSDEAYAKRLADHKKWVEDDCRWHVKNAYKVGLSDVSEYGRKRLRECGYDPETLKPIEQ